MKRHKLLLGKLLIWLFDDTVSVGVLASIIPTLSCGVSQPYGWYTIFPQNFEPDSWLRLCFASRSRPLAASLGIWRKDSLDCWPAQWARCFRHSQWRWSGCSCFSRPSAARPLWSPLRGFVAEVCRTLGVAVLSGATSLAPFFGLLQVLPHTHTHTYTCAS